MKKFSCRAVGIWRLGFSDVFFQTNVELGLEARREEEKPISARDEAGHNSLGGSYQNMQTKRSLHCLWCHMLMISALRRCRQDEQDLEVTLGHLAGWRST